MIKKVNDILAGIPATLIGGVFLVLSFVLTRIGVKVPADPAWITIIISGIPLLYLAMWRIIHNPGISKISSALLITIAMFAAIAIGDLFAAGEVAFIMAIGAILEDMTTERAKKGLKKLIGLAPVQGRRIVNGREEMVLAEQIKRGDLLRVLPGETIPVDGIIINGETSVDQSIMTGESLPVDKEIGDDVFCGTINRFGAIDIEATKVGQDSSLQKLIRMVQEAENKKAPMARIADKCASWLVPVALLIAIIAGIVTKDLVRAVTVLVVFCPCALVLATPTAIMAAIGQATKHGVIIKSGEALEKMGKVDTIAFDKTGTLTYGCLEVSDIISFNTKTDENTLLSLTASAEAKSEHPLGKAIVACANEKGISIAESDSFKMTTGKGIYAEVSGKKLLCGNEKFLIEKGISIKNEVCTQLELLRAQGKASVLVAEVSIEQDFSKRFKKDIESSYYIENTESNCHMENAEKNWCFEESIENTEGNYHSENSVQNKGTGICLGIIALSDVLRENASEMVSKLSAMNTRTVLLTGDNQKTADYFADKAGITEVRAELLPEEKVSNITEIQKNGNLVCMIGDGVNDAPALKTASVGVAMGSMGSDIAVEAADIALMSDDISKIPYLKRLSNATVKTIKFSIGLSMTINFMAVTLSVLGILNPTTGALVHNAGSCFVVLIAALLYDRKFE